ncbi:MAG: hypothetical protein WBG88_03785 [Mesorhizobium sp.]
MQSILTQTAPMLMLTVVGFCLLSLGGSFAVLGLWRRIFHGSVGQVPTPAFLGIVATAWALSLGFAASDVWTLAARADHAISAERSSAKRLLGISEKRALDLPALHAAVTDYARLVQTVEWEGMLAHGPDARVEEAVQKIRLGLIEMVERGIAAPLVNKAVQDFDELQDARNDRLAIGESAVDETKWYLVLCLTVMAMVTIAVVHADTPKAARNALFIFAVVVGACLWIMAINANPYAGMPVNLIASLSRS